MAIPGYDAWKLQTPPEYSEENEPEYEDNGCLGDEEEAEWNGGGMDELEAEDLARGESDYEDVP